MYQPSIFDQTRGKELADIGLSLALETADKEFPLWSERCWNLFLRWLKKKPEGFEFMTENFRRDCYKFNMIEKPKSDRSFGFIPKRALKKGLIINMGTAPVTNSGAHATPANVWRKK